VDSSTNPPRLLSSSAGRGNQQRPAASTISICAFMGCGHRFHYAVEIEGDLEKWPSRPCFKTQSANVISALLHF